MKAIELKPGQQIYHKYGVETVKNVINLDGLVTIETDNNRFIASPSATRISKVHGLWVFNKAGEKYWKIIWADTIDVFFTERGFKSAMTHNK